MALGEMELGEIGQNPIVCGVNRHCDDISTNFVVY